MTTNLPILYQNIISGLPTQAAEEAFLWAAGKIPNDPFLYRAEAFAREVGHVVAVTNPMIEAAFRLHGNVPQNVRENLTEYLVTRMKNTIKPNT